MQTYLYRPFSVCLAILFVTFGCASSSQNAEHPDGWANHQEVPRILGRAATDSFDLRVFHETATLFPYMMYEVRVRSNGEAKMSVFAWWPFQSLAEREIAREHLARDNCEGGVTQGAAVLVCRSPCESQLTESASSILTEVLLILQDPTFPKEMNSIVHGPNGTINVVSDGETVILERPGSEETLIHNPDLCSDEICGLTSALISEFKSICWPELMENSLPEEED